STKKMAKRKKGEEYRTFQDEWTEEFAFVERAGSAVCLICNDKIASMKRSNVKQHFDTRHATFASKYPAGDSRKKACQELLSSVQASQQQLRVWTRQGDYNSASFAGSLAIAMNRKPFTDGEYAKTFMLDVANELFDDLPNKDKIIKRIKDMPLSARTVKDINAALFFSLALDESTDASHLSQFSVIARYPAGDTLHEESLAVLPIKGSTRGEDLFKSFMEFAQGKNLPMEKIFAAGIDGPPCMVGKNKGFVALFHEHENRPILSFHCILHQEALCAQMCDGQLGEVMSLDIRVINFIVARALNDRQFKTLLDEVGNNYHGLLLHSNVRWLSRGKVLCRFAACLDEIRTFLAMKGIEHPELAETERLLKFYYLVDMTENLNQLNVKMQGIGNKVLSLQQVGLLFKTSWSSLSWILKHVVYYILKNLDILKMYLASHPVCYSRSKHALENFVSTLVFSSSSPIQSSLNNADLSYIPGVSVSDFEAEVADLKASDMWVNKFNWRASKYQLIIKTWKVLPVTYHTLQRVSIAVLTMFGSTYACEQSFSHLNNINLNACMKLNLTKYQQDYKAISKSMQHQKSH
uniref:SPIN-DOC-like zinc-finger domain-containing protein n=1 Tax=Fundulus heteroclitus TaxID=8078 RepID=A0A3Q2STM4_FUNHE